MGTLHTLDFPRQAQVFTPHVCTVLAEANRLIRALRATGATPVRLTLLPQGHRAELTINGGHVPRIDSDLVHVTRQF